MMADDEQQSPRLLGDWPVSRRADAIADARRYVRVLIAPAVRSAEACDDVELMTSELLTNAVRYGEGDKAQVHVTTTPTALRVEVRDDGRGTLPDSPESDPFDERGRGLLIVAALSARWGLDRDETGTTAWFEYIRIRDQSTP
jgi:anti-sigma regulatory factor (Ser/Thr protein kinase)